MSSLKALYRAELAKKELAKEAECASFEEAKAKLATLYRSITSDREFLDSIRADVDLIDDDLHIDPGPIMIMVTAQQNGDFKLEYEVKRPDDYQTTPLPEVRTIEDVEHAIAKLLVQYADDDR